MPSTPNMEHFTVLGLLRTATEPEVKKAYRDLALLHHPDKVGPAGEEKMKQVNVAYELIINRELCGASKAFTTVPRSTTVPETRSAAPPKRHFTSTSTRRPWTNKSEPAQGYLLTSVSGFIRRVVNSPSSQRQRRPKSAAYRDSAQIETLLRIFRALKNRKTDESGQYHALGRLLNLAKRVLVSEQVTVAYARLLFEQMDFEFAVRQATGDHPEWISGQQLAAMRKGWICIASTWTANRVWRDAQAGTGAGHRTTSK